MAKKRTEPDEEVVDTIVLNTLDLLERLNTAEAELVKLAPAPRVTLDRDAVLGMIRLCRQAIRDLSQVH